MPPSSRNAYQEWRQSVNAGDERPSIPWTHFRWPNHFIRLDKYAATAKETYQYYFNSSPLTVGELRHTNQGHWHRGYKDGVEHEFRNPGVRGSEASAISMMRAMHHNAPTRSPLPDSNAPGYQGHYNRGFRDGVRDGVRDANNVKHWVNVDLKMPPTSPDPSLRRGWFG